MNESFITNSKDTNNERLSLCNFVILNTFKKINLYCSSYNYTDQIIVVRLIYIPTDSA